MNPFRRILRWYLSKESLPYWSIFLIDGVVIMLSGVFSYWIFSQRGMVIGNMVPLFCTLLIYLAFSFIGVRIFHTYAGIVRYSSFIDLQRVGYANLLSLALAFVLHYVLLEVPEGVLLHLTGREVFVMYLIATLLMWAFRVIVKTLYDVTTSTDYTMRVMIYGAMSSGVGVAKNIRSQTPKRYLLKGFISHDSRYRHSQLMGEKVYGVDDDIEKIIKEKRIEAILVSPLRTEDFRKNQKIQDILIGAGVKIFFAQGAKEMIVENGVLTEEDFSNVQIHEVSVEDLLPREEIRVDMKSVGELLVGKKVLITGSAGSIGSEMVRQIAVFKPSLLILIDQAETPQHDIGLMMTKDFPDVHSEVIVTSISRQQRMEAVFSQYRPDYVFHAAAYKHVPMMEDNPSEAVLNNIYGTKVIADLSVKYGVKKFVMISTDKAVNPTNVMGASKRICEIYVQAYDRELKIKRLQDLNPKDGGTQFVTTRFGNVLGSSGSVIPLFREQIKNGGPVTVTHPDIIRFFMLIPEACKLVLEAGTKGNGGEIFVFDMGQPVKISNLAKRMIKLSGAKNVKIEYTGLREGEKLYEEVLSEAENTKPTFHEKIRIAEVREYDYAEVSKDIDELIDLSKQYDDMATVKKMKEIVPEYKSNNSRYEELD